jgi:ubiquinone/menaquinone biosynthesis C-methylase UbiE
MKETSQHYSYRVYADPTIARSFDASRFGGPIGELLKETQESLIFTMLPDVRGWKVIDVGAGTGRLTVPFLKRGAEVTACDASPQMLEVLSEKINDPHLKVCIADAHKLEFADHEFDCAISSRMLMHVLDWKKSLSELCRVSKNWVIFDFPPRHFFLLSAPIVQFLQSLFLKDVQKYRTFNIRKVRDELKRNDFEVLYVDHGYFLPIWIHRKIGRRGFTTSIESSFRMMGITRFAGSPLTFFARRKK